MGYALWFMIISNERKMKKKKNNTEKKLIDFLTLIIERIVMEGGINFGVISVFVDVSYPKHFQQNA